MDVATASAGMYPVMQGKAEDYYSNVMRMESTATENTKKESKKREKLEKEAAEALKKEWQVAIEAAKKALDDLKEKAGEPKPIKIDNVKALEKLDDVATAIEDIDKKVEGDEGGARKLWLDTSPFRAAMDLAIDKVKELIDWIAKIPRDVTINVNVKTSGAADGKGSSPASVAASATSGGQGKGGGAVYPVFASGGHISGYGGGDTVPAMLERGEFVFTKEVTRALGAPLLDAINRTRSLPSVVNNRLGFQGGGQVPNMNVQDLGRLEIAVGNQAFPVMVKPNVANELVKALRRERLVSA